MEIKEVKNNTNLEEAGLPNGSQEKYYQDVRQIADSNATRSGKELDNITLILITGGLILASNLIISLPVHDFLIKLLLITACYFLIAGLIIHSASYYKSISYNRQIVFLLDEWKRSDYKNKLNYPQVKKFSGRSLIDNLAFVFTIIGLVLLTIFITIILFNDTNMKNNLPDKKVEKSADSIIPPEYTGEQLRKPEEVKPTNSPANSNQNAKE